MKESQSGLQPAGGYARFAIMSLVSRTASRGAVLWGIFFGIAVGASLYGFLSAYPTVESRVLLARTLGANAGMQAMIGESRNIDTAAGFVEWRALGICTFVGAVWALLAGTRLLRGEEEAGRWELLLAGQTTRRRAAANALAGLGISLVVLTAVASVFTVASGFYPNANYPIGASLYFGLVLAGSAWICMPVAALASQLAPARRAAATWAAGTFGLMFMGRAMADSAPSLHWISWLTPLGWIESLHPLTGGEPLMLIPIVAFIAVLSVATILLAGRRDMGASSLPDRDSARARTGLLNGPLGLTVRLTQGNLLAWVVGVSVVSLMFGLVAKTAAEAMGESIFIKDLFTNLGARSQAMENFLGMIFFLLTTLITMYAAAQVSATREEEANGCVENLLVRLVSRSRWMAARVLATIAGMLVLSLVAGAISWSGTYAQDSGLALSSLMTAGLNTLPPAMLVLGIGTLVHGALPRLASPLAYGLIAWSFLVELVGTIAGANHYFLDLSIFHHMALAPAADIRWDAAGIFVGLGLAGAVLGVVLFNRRDIAGY